MCLVVAFLVDVVSQPFFKAPRRPGDRSLLRIFGANVTADANGSGQLPVSIAMVPSGKLMEVYIMGLL
jgi:hypothetical protein